MLVLALVWWAWSAWVWAANAQTAGSPILRFCLLAASISIFISGLSIPHAFGREGTLFAVTYAIVRFLHLAVYVDASKRGNAKWSSTVGFMVTITIGMVVAVALYLVGNASFAARMTGSIEHEKLAVAAGLLVLYAVGGRLAAWVLAAAVAIVLGILCAAESEAVRRVISPAAGKTSTTAG